MNKEIVKLNIGSRDSALAIAQNDKIEYESLIKAGGTLVFLMGFLVFTSPSGVEVFFEYLKK